MRAFCWRYTCTAIVIWLSNVLPTSEKEDQPLRYSISEELPRGTVVSDLTKYTAHKYPPGVAKLLRFRFLSETVTMFHIDSTSGIITTAVIIDRDDASLCRQKDTCEVSLDVVIQPTQYFEILKIIVEVLDLNDNVPLFRESKVSLPINEAALVESSYIVPKAMDYDSPRYGIQRYELGTDTNRFRLNVNAKLDGTLEVKLVLHSKLDRELESKYRLRIMACDGGVPLAKTGTLTVDVDVVDSNDNRPEFAVPQYRVNVSENLPVGSVIVTVQATDRDAGSNGLVGYAFAARTRNLHGGIFGIRNATGEIYIKGNIDYEKSASYQLVVVAQDHGPDVLSAEIQVVVDVQDVNDNAPSVTIQTLNGNNADISEDAAVNTFVAHVTVSDRDSGVNGHVTCSINEKVFALVQKSDTNYQILTAAPLDRERTDKYTLVMKCQDSAVMPRVTEKILTVVIVDVNDNSPTFTRQLYKASVFENNLIGTSILEVSGQDYDDGDNGRIEYRIPGDHSAWFHIDQRGIISVQRSIDREAYGFFRIPVLAVDGGVPPRTGSTLVAVAVEDINDEPPRFSRTAYVFSVGENQPVGTQVGVLEASDKDAGPNNVFFFAFSPAAVIADCFSVDHVTGVITTQKVLDREVVGLYDAEVVVYDQRVISMTDRATLSINVLDANDNTPEFIFPGGANNTVAISNRLPVGRHVVQIVARDRDFGKNAELSFSAIQERSNTTTTTTTTTTTFTLDPKTGTLYLSLPLENLDFATYHLTIRVSDHGSPSRHASASLYIAVNASIQFAPDPTEPESVSGTLMSAYGLVVGIGVMSGCVLVVVVLVTAVLVVVRQRRRHRDKFNGRMEGLQMLRAKDQQVASCSSPEGTPHKKLQNGTKPLLSKDSSVPTEGSESTEKERREFAHPCRNLSSQGRIWLIDKGAEVVQQSSSSSSSHRPTMADVEKESIHSVEGSVTDSGRGPSEEEEAGHARHNRERCIPPPPPPPRGAYWLMPKKCHGVLTPAGHHQHHHHHHQSVRFQGVDGEDDPPAEVFPNRTVNLGGSPGGAEALRSPRGGPGPGGESRTLPCRMKHGRKDETDGPRSSVICSNRAPNVENFTTGGPSFFEHTGTALRVPAGGLLRRGGEAAFRTIDELAPMGDEVSGRTLARSSSGTLYGHAVLRRKSHDWSRDGGRSGVGHGSNQVGPDVVV